MENDTPQGGESLTIDQAAAAYAKAIAPTEVEKDDHTEDTAAAESGDTTDDELQASDEDVSEEADGDTDNEEHPDDAGGEEPDTEQGRFVADDAKVRLADGTVTSVHELKRGFLRESDYTRKTQEAAALQTETAAERERIKASKEQVEQQSRYMADLIRSIVPDEPDVSMTDPASPNFDIVGYNRQLALRGQWIAHLQNLDQQAQQTVKEREAETVKEREAKATKEWAALLEKEPDLKDQKRADVFITDVRKYGTELGFTPQELAQLGYDHRMARVMRGYVKWEKLQASKASVPKKVEGRPPVQKGGKRLNPSEHKARAADDAMNRLKQSGRVEDAAAAYLATRKTG